MLSPALLILASIPAAAQSGGAPIDPLRWESPYAYPDFIGMPKSVAVGDDGALTVVGRLGSGAGIDFHAGGSADPLHLERFGELSYVLRVDAADHAPVAAAFSLMDIDPDPSVYLLEPRVRFYEAGAAITESWSWAFPAETQWFLNGGGVRVSDDGEVAVAWWDSVVLGLARVATLRRDGSLQMQVDLPMQNSGYRTGGLRLDDAGSRALVPTASAVRLLDLETGAILTQSKTPTGSPLTGISLSGDGQRYATSTWQEVVLWEESAPGTWTKVLALPQEGDERYGPVELDQDGSRLAFTVQHMNPTDRFELVLLDVDSQSELFRVMQSEPATYEPLHAEDLALDDAGSTVACASLGDALHTTPEIFVYDDAGNLLGEYFQDGSGVDVDLDSRGEVLAAGVSPKYGDIAFVGGHMLQADARAPRLRILGEPALGGDLEVTLAGGPSGSRALLLASTALGASATPFGISTLDLSQRVLRFGPWPVVSGLAQQSIPIGTDPDLAGLLLHYQGIILDGGNNRLTNKVSVRMVP